MLGLERCRRGASEGRSRSSPATSAMSSPSSSSSAKKGLERRPASVELSAVSFVLGEGRRRAREGKQSNPRCPTACCFEGTALRVERTSLPPSYSLLALQASAPEPSQLPAPQQRRALRRVVPAPSCDVGGPKKEESTLPYTPSFPLLTCTGRHLGERWLKGEIRPSPPQPKSELNVCQLA